MSTPGDKQDKENKEASAKTPAARGSATTAVGPTDPAGTAASPSTAEAASSGATKASTTVASNSGAAKPSKKIKDIDLSVLGPSYKSRSLQTIFNLSNEQLELDINAYLTSVHTGKTILYMACEDGFDAITELLLKNGADPMDGYSRRTPAGDLQLTYPIETNSIDCVRVLLKDPNLNLGKICQTSTVTDSHGIGITLFDKFLSEQSQTADGFNIQYYLKRMITSNFEQHPIAQELFAYVHERVFPPPTEEISAILRGEMVGLDKDTAGVLTSYLRAEPLEKFSKLIPALDVKTQLFFEIASKKAYDELEKTKRLPMKIDELERENAALGVELKKLREELESLKPPGSSTKPFIPGYEKGTSTKDRDAAASVTPPPKSPKPK